VLQKSISNKSLPPKTKQEVKELCTALIDVLSGEKELSVGLGLKNLRKNFWEIRKGLKLRVLFRWRTDNVEFVLAGTHEEIKRYLKR
jgi:hypothetical protein